ncbi:MAG: PilZ domain-containing protein [Candidatus Omnitrophica bacterium]|nr:PilZ domain-containing protein [Candidatus Omnitrophota bacterium]
MQEKRLFEREGITLSVKLSSESKINDIEAKALDISPLGVGLISEVPLDKGLALEIRVELPGNEQIYLRGEVVWSAKIEDKIRIGVRLDDPEVIKVAKILARYKTPEVYKL